MEPGTPGLKQRLRLLRVDGDLRGAGEEHDIPVAPLLRDGGAAGGVLVH